MSAEDEDIRVSRENRNALNSRQPTIPDVGEMVVGPISSLPGRIVGSGGEAEQGRSGQAEQERSRGQAEQQGAGLHLWTPGGSSYNDDVTYVVTTALASESAMVLDVVRNRRRRFPRGDVDQARAAHTEATDGTGTGISDGFLSTSGSRELQKVEEENRSLRDSFHCKICFENPIDAVFMPCGHRFSCLVCSQRCLEEQERLGLSHTCTVCRCPTSVMHVHTS